MELLFVLLTGFTLGISGAMIPGPLTLYAISEVLKTSKSAGVKIIIGHIIVEGILAVVILQGFQRFITNSVFLLWVSGIGAVALMIMGCLLLLYARAMTIPSSQAQHSFSHGLIFGGIFFSAISPGFLIWWATIGLSSIMKSLLLGFSGLVVIMFGHWLADILWYGFLSYAVERGKMYLSDRSYQNIIRFFACMLILLGVFFSISNRAIR